MFISWVGPRGIVAAGIASLFGSKLIKQGVEGAEYITPMVFMIVLGTVLLNATTARIFAKAVGVFLKRSNAIMIIGANSLGKLIAEYLKQHNRRVVLIDSNNQAVEQAKNDGFDAYEVNIYDDELTDNIELNDVGYLIALTGSDAVNKYAISNFSSIFGEQGAYRLASSQEIITDEYDDVTQLFTIKDDYINLMETIRDYPQIHETPINSIKEYKRKIDKLHEELKSVPILVKSQTNELLLVNEFESKVKQVENWKLIYLGKELEF